MVLTAALAKSGRLEEAKAAAMRVLQLLPSFRVSQLLVGLDCAPVLAGPLREALLLAGLPE